MDNINYDFMAAPEIFDIPDSQFKASMEAITDSSSVFDEDDGTISTRVVPGTDKKLVCWGYDNELPYNVAKMIGRDEVMAQNKLFNVLTCYGSGLKYIDPDTGKPTNNKEVRDWLHHNSIPRIFLEQATDMKYYFFCVAVLILSKDGSKITNIVHKEACHCRFEVAKDGVVEHIFYANWRRSYVQPDEVECIPLLSERDPIGDLDIRMGRAPGKDGLNKVRTSERKFAVVVKYPTVGSRYYPIPYYTSIFRGDWYDIKRLIGRGKKAKLKNHASVKYQVEVHKDFWRNIIDEEHITDPIKAQERIKKEKENIKNFVAGIENSGKVWITGYYIDPNGHENRMVRVNMIDTGKEGGDWSEDIQEASNMTCYCDNIHPNLVGATPGKSQSNNSGSDKRELFTLKQSLEISFHDLMALPHEMVIHYNGWEEFVVPDVAMILLTTLDQHTDAKKISSNTKADNYD
jgi:hypothetical protein